MFTVSKLGDSALPAPSVLVVGGGLVGLSMGLFLAGRGVQVVVSEKHAGSSLHPRAMGFTTRTMELYRAAGLGQEIPQVPFGSGRPRRLKVESLAGQWSTAEVAWTPDKSGDEADQAAAAPLEYSICTGAALAQDRLEPILREKAVALGADIRLSTTLISFAQDADGVTAVLQRRDGGEYEMRADYMVAADGYSSSIRQALGIGRSGRGELRTVRSVLFRARLDQYLDSGISQFEIEQPNFTAMLTTYRDGRWLLMFSDDEERGEASLMGFIQKAIGRDDIAIEIITTGRWELSASIADQFSSGRVFLAGDAAHTLPPARGGYGANTGIEDAHNLAWKLDAVLSGEARRGLLDTYDAERRPVAWLRHDQIFARPDYAQFVRATDKDTPIIDDAAMELGQLYQSEAVSGAGERLPPALRPEQWAGQPGTRAPHVWVSVDGMRISTLDLVQPNWVLLTENEHWRATVEAAAEHLAVKLTCVVVGAAAVSPAVGSVLDMPIERIAGDPVGRRVLDATFPQIMSHTRYATFKPMSLRQLQPVSQGQIADETLAQVQANLAAVGFEPAMPDPIDPGAFRQAFGTGSTGASLIRPDGYVAWRTAEFLAHAEGDFLRALSQVAFATPFSNAAPVPVKDDIDAILLQPRR